MPEKKKKIKNKPPKPKKGKKHLQQIQLFASTKGGLGDAEAAGIDASIIYSKSVTGAVEVRLDAIPERDAPATPSYDLHMILPGFGSGTLTDGMLCDLMGSTYTISNPSPFTITLRIQRPMGYRDDCVSLAMWEALGGKLVHEISPKGKLTLGSANTSTSHMVPREETLQGHRCVHLVSFAAFRESISDVGVISNTGNQVGLILEVVTRYKAANGSMGQQQAYITQSFEGSKRLDHVVAGPLTPLRVNDINCKEGNCERMGLVQASNVDQLAAVFYHGGKESDPDLDTRTMYRFPAGPSLFDKLFPDLLRPMDILSFQQSGSDPQVGEWLVGILDYDNGGFVFRPGSVKAKTGGKSTPFRTSLDYAPDTWLTPATTKPVKRSIRYRPGKASLGVQTHKTPLTHTEYGAIEAGIVSTIVQGLVIIYEVSKVAVEVLGVVGLLANPEVNKPAEDFVLVQ